MKRSYEDIDGFQLPSKASKIAKRKEKLQRPGVSLSIPSGKSMSLFDIHNLILWILTDAHGTLPKWCIVQNKHMISRVRLIVIPCLDHGSLLRLLDSASSPFFNEALRGKLFPMRSVMVHPDKILDAVTEVAIPAKAAVAFQSLTEDEPLSEEQVSLSISDLVMTDEALRANRYPMPLADGLLPPGFIRGNGSEDRVIAMDCEMVMTEFGLELARVSMVDEEGVVLLDLLVRPDNLIVDYLTKHSGITADLLRDVSTTFRQAQRQVAALISPTTVLVGHSLENDLNSLKIIHDRVIDTSEIYPHPRGPPAKLSLSMLAYKALKEKMNRDDGHDSVDDARMTMRLMQKKMLRGINYNPCSDVTNRVKVNELVDKVIVGGSDEVVTIGEDVKLIVEVMSNFQIICEAETRTDEKAGLADVDYKIRERIAKMTETELVVVISGCGNTIRYFQLMDLKAKCTDADAAAELERLCQLAKHDALNAFGIVTTVHDLSFNSS